MVIALGDQVAELIQQRMGWHNVHDAQTGDPIRRIQRHAVRRASAPVMADQIELVKPQLGHQIQLIAAHFAKGIRLDTLWF